MLRATFAGFSTALSAMQANQKRLDITGQNLANMNTVGYTRQQLETSSLNYTNPVSKYMSSPDLTVGFGVSMDRVSQIRDPYLDAQYRTQMSKSTYSDSIQVALDSLASVLDESDTSGIRQALDDVQSVLQNMTDSPKVNDPVYETELRSRMQILASRLNEAANQIAKSEQDEFDRLDGTGTSENGAQQEVNDLLRQIGDLNVQIKRNQVLGQPSLELMDERNNLLDTLSGYIPIEVSYFKDAAHSGTRNVTITTGTDADGNPITKTVTVDAMDELDKNGRVIGRKEWPDDLKVEMVLSDGQKITLVNGSEGGLGKNYGKMKINGDRPSPDADDYGANTKITATFTEAGGTSTVTIGSYGQNGLTVSSGSIQAGLDMLDSTGKPGTTGVNSYEYYNNQLDTLAKAFSDVMNKLNNKGGKYDGDLFISRDGGTITASNITINPKWTSGDVQISTMGNNPNDTVMNMLEAMTTTYGNRLTGTGNANFTSDELKNQLAGLNIPLGGKTFAGFMNNTSTILANDSLNNKTALKTNVTVLNGLQDSRDSVSGVSLDEEASNMMTYLSAYNAAARLMTALDEALNTLINNTGLVGR